LEFETFKHSILLQEYEAELLKASDEAHAGIGLISHEEAAERIKKYMHGKRKVESHLEK
jgi:hypothetical protein